MKGVNHREEGSRHISQVYYQHSSGKDSQAGPLPAPSQPWAGRGGATAEGAENARLILLGLHQVISPISWENEEKFH